MRTGIKTPMSDYFLYDKIKSISQNVMTEHLKQIAVMYVVTVIKGSHVTRRRGYVPQCVTQDTRESTATNVRYPISSFYCRSHLKMLLKNSFSYDLLLFSKRTTINLDKYDKSMQ